MSSVLGSQLVSGVVLAVFSVVLHFAGRRLARWISARDLLRKDLADTREEIRIERGAINQLAYRLGIDPDTLR